MAAVGEKRQLALSHSKTSRSETVLGKLNDASKEHSSIYDGNEIGMPCYREVMENIRIEQGFFEKKE